MARDAHIPIFLWVATAALVHILWGWEAERAATVLESQEKVRRFAQSVMRHVHQENQTQEIALLSEGELQRLLAPLADGAVPVEPPEEETLEEETPSEPSNDAPRAKLEIEEELAARKIEPPKPKPEPEQLQVEVKKQPDVTVVPMQPDRRISVQQQVPDKEEPDNPNAEFIADQAHHVERQTQARITSADENSAAPNPGSNVAPPAAEPGNASLTDIGQADDTPGNPETAAAESNKEGRDRENASAVEHSVATQPLGAEAAKLSQGQQTDSQAQAKAASAGQRAQAEQQAAAQSPELLDSAHGDPGHTHGAEESQEARAARSAVRRQLPTRGRRSPDLRGFGNLNTTPGGLNPNLNPSMALAVIGADQLSRERRADGERRRSKHRGSWTSVGLEKWRSAIENYVASVQVGQTTELGTARVPFASYLNRIHQRLHPEFADDFLGSLGDLPGDHALNRVDLKTFLELVVSKQDGSVVKMGITRASGSTAFDVAVLEAVKRASPFGPPPGEIVSPDGNVYLHWEFHRNPDYACSTYFAHPYILRSSPVPAPSPEVPRPPQNPEETPLEGQRHGLRSVNGADQDG